MRQKKGALIEYVLVPPFRKTKRHTQIHIHVRAQYYGPYKIVEQITPVSYRLALPEGCKFHDVFHVMRLKSAHENTFKHRKPKKLPAVRDKYYEVDKILSDRVKYGHKEFLISWKGYSMYESSWLREKELKCPKKIQEYLETKAL